MKIVIKRTRKINKGRVIGRGSLGVTLIPGLLICLVLVITASNPVFAKTFNVDTKDDLVDANPGDGTCATSGSECSLRAAIQEANALAGPDEIFLQARVYFLTISGTEEDSAAEGDLDIIGDLTITGKGANKTFINGSKLDRVFHVNGVFIFDINGITVQNGFVDNSGGGILNDGGAVTIKDSNLSSNIAQGTFAIGGGIYNNGGSANIINSVVSSNTAFGTSNNSAGGGVYNWSGTLTIRNSIVLNNIATGMAGRGGGIFNGGTGTDPVIKIIRSTVSNNAALGSNGFSQGGGIYSQGIITFSNPKVVIKKTTISNNIASGFNVSAAGGGIWHDGGNLKVVGSILSKNNVLGNTGIGGGIFKGAGLMTVSRTRILDNKVSGTTGNGRGGGIFYSSADPSIIKNRSKIIRNFASTSGGGIRLTQDTLTISSDSVVSGNIPSDIE
jgi:CSLREA domain-containing protein